MSYRTPWPLTRAARRWVRLGAAGRAYYPCGAIGYRYRAGWGQRMAADSWITWPAWPADGAPSSLGTLSASVTSATPVVAAKMAATLDH